MTFYHFKKKFKWPWFISLYYKPRQYPGFTRADVRKAEDWILDRDLGLAHRDDRYNWLNTWVTPGFFQYWSKKNLFKRFLYEIHYIKWLFSCYFKLYLFDRDNYYIPLNFYKKRLFEVIKYWIPVMYLVFSFWDWWLYLYFFFFTKFQNEMIFWSNIIFGVWFSYFVWVLLTLIFPSLFSYIDERPEVTIAFFSILFIWPFRLLFDSILYAWMYFDAFFPYFFLIWGCFFLFWACEEEIDDSVTPDQLEIYYFSPFHPAYYFWDFETVFNVSSASYHDWLILGEDSLFKRFEFYNTYLRAFFYENPLRHTKKSYLMWRRFFR